MTYFRKIKGCWLENHIGWQNIEGCEQWHLTNLQMTACHTDLRLPEGIPGQTGVCYSEHVKWMMFCLYCCVLWYILAFLQLCLRLVIRWMRNQCVYKAPFQAFACYTLSNVLHFVLCGFHFLPESLIWRSCHNSCHLNLVPAIHNPVTNLGRNAVGTMHLSTAVYP